MADDYRSVADRFSLPNKIVHDDKGYYVIEGLVSISGKEPEWIPAPMAMVNGWHLWKEHPERIKFHYQIAKHFVLDAMAVRSPDTALKMWADVVKLPQDLALRLVRVQETITKLVLDQIIEDPDDKG